MTTSFSKCNLLVSAIFIFLSVSLTSSIKIVAHSCSQFSVLVMAYCEAYSGPNPIVSRSFDSQSVCCYLLQMHKCLTESHNATCQPPRGIDRYNRSNYNCSQFTDLSKCDDLFNLSPATVTFITVAILCIIGCLGGFVFCHLYFRDDNSDLMPSCQLTDFKVPSKSDLQDSSSSSIKVGEDSCSTPILNFPSEPQSMEKDNSSNLPEPIHPSLLDLNVANHSLSSSSSLNQ